MAKRTIKRNPFSVDTDGYELNKQYFNFTEFKGINSNKNYVTIDQQSFEEADNVYVNQDGELSTRPVTNRISILPANEQLIDMVKINNLTIYHTKDGDTYRIRFKYKDNWYSNPEDIVIEDKIKCINIDSRYIVFMPTSIIGFEYDYKKENTFKWYNTNDLVYVPVTKVVGGESNFVAEDDNLFTASHITRYIFQQDVPVNTNDINGKEVTITIGEETFTLEFVENNQMVFSVPLSDISSLDIDEIHASTGNTPMYLAYKYVDNKCYISYDGVIFITLTFPGRIAKSDTNQKMGFAVFLSDDGSSVFYHFKAWEHSTSTTFDNSIWRFTIPSSPSDINSANWVEYPYALNYKYTRLNYRFNVSTYPSSSVTSYSTHIESCGIALADPGEYTLVGIRADIFRPFGHSPSSGYAIVILPADVVINVWQNSELTYSETGTERSTQIVGRNLCIICVFYNGDAEGYLSATGTSDLIKYNNNNKVMLITSNTYSLAFIAVDCMETPVSGRPIIGERFYNRALVFNSYMIPQSKVISNRTIGPVTEGSTITTNYCNYAIRSYFANNNEISALFYTLSGNDISSLYDGFDFIGTYLNNTFTTKAFAKYSNSDYLYITNYRSISHVAHWNESYYSDTFDYNGAPTGSKELTRSIYPYVFTEYSQHDKISSVASSRYLLSLNGMLTDKYLRYNDQNIPLLERGDDTIYANSPIWLNDEGTLFTYYSIDNNTIYSNSFGEITVDYEIVGQTTIVFPTELEQFITISMSVDNLLYQSLKRGGKIYFPVNSKVEFIDDITAMTIFSQTSLGVFLEDNVYEYMYNANNDLYTLAPTKLQLGCKKGSDVLLSYDASTILLTNIKGLTGLTYQDFVQSTEQVYNYLTENITNLYYEFATSPIKLYQYKNWVFMYRQDSEMLYVYDVRNASWWRWELLYPVTKILYNNEELVLQMNNMLYVFDFDTFSIYDDKVHAVNWRIVSQKLHFNAPNYYKVVNQLSVITTRSTDNLRYKLAFVNYRNLQNLIDTDTVEFEVNQLATLIKRVTFMKLNAFQFAISNDKTNKYPTPFITSDIAIQYRITERVR